MKQTIVGSFDMLTCVMHKEYKDAMLLHYYLLCIHCDKKVVVLTGHSLHYVSLQKYIEGYIWAIYFFYFMW